MASVTVLFTFLDSKSKTSKTTVRVPTGLTLAQYVEFAQDFGQLIVNCCNGQMTGAKLTFQQDLSSFTLKGTASVLADVAQKGYFRFTGAVANAFKRLRLPTFDEGLVESASDQIPQAQTDVAAFIAAMEDGIAVTSGTITPVTERGYDLVALTDARETFSGKR